MQFDVGPTTHVDKYELVGAVPTRVLKPSSVGSSFTCYAFSSAGDRFVTGETDGTIRYALLNERLKIDTTPQDVENFQL